MISLGAAGITATASATIVVPDLAFATGLAKGGEISGQYIVSGNLYGHGSAADAYSDLTGYSYLSGGTGASFNLQAIGVRTADQGLRTANGALFQANAGNDSIAFGDTLARVSATTFAGGAGNDLIGGYTYVNEQWAAGRVSATFISSDIEGGKGDDTIALNGDGVYSAVDLNANQGNDLVRFIGTVSGFSNNVIGLGAGNDTLSGEFRAVTSTTLAGGKGNDMIYASATEFAYAVIAGDRANGGNTDGDGNDSIHIEGAGTFTGSTIYGGAGNDTITFSATVFTAGLISLNKGADVFSGEGINEDSTLAMGAGNDAFHLVEWFDSFLQNQSW